METFSCNKECNSWSEGESFKSTDTRRILTTWRRKPRDRHFHASKSVHVRTLFTSRVNSVRETGTNDSWNAPPGGFKGKYRKCLFYLHCLNSSRELRLQFQPFPPFSSLYPRNYSWFLSYISQTSIFLPRLSFTVTSTAWGELLATSVQTVSTWHSAMARQFNLFWRSGTVVNKQIRVKWATLIK